MTKFQLTTEFPRSLRRLRHELKLSVLCGWPYVRRRFVTRFPRMQPWRTVPCSDGGPEVHILTSTRDYVLAIWAAATYYRLTGRSSGLVIHEYDRLSTRAGSRIREHFPDARIIFRAEADPIVRHYLAHFPRLLSLRERLPMMIKLIDAVALSQARRIVNIDSDVLFFRTPEELTSPEDGDIPQHVFSRDIQSAYSVSADHTESKGFRLPPAICAGLASINRGAVDFSYLEAFLATGLVDLRTVDHRIEQTLWAVECGRSGFCYLPATYAIRSGGEPRNVVAQHYVGPVRHLFFTEGIPQAARVLTACSRV